jgi:hypothetical protein
MIDFKVNQFPKSVILYAVFFYVRYGVSYRDLEEVMAERGVDIDHVTCAPSSLQLCAGVLGVKSLALGCHLVHGLSL